ncbi:MAG TPA: hypothetical protein VGC76_00060 [Pyrinomonadaceae bacterium]|jgi:hypothetical protein
MFLKSKFIRIVCSLCLIFSLAALTFADTIRLKDGSIIKGKIVNFNGGQFTVLIGDGTRQRRMNFYADEIESIEFDQSALSTVSTKTSTQLPVKSNSTSTNPNTTKPAGDTIINVGQTDKTNNPVTSSPKIDTSANQNSTVMPTPVSTSTNNATTNPGYTNSLPKPVQLGVKVLADNTANGWTNSGWVVKKGQKIKISGIGSVSLGNGNYTTPGGIYSLSDKDKLMSNEATGGLIAVIGDDNNDFIFVGNSKEFVAPRDGALFLGINEANLDDNSGAFDVTIEIMP